MEVRSLQLKGETRVLKRKLSVVTYKLKLSVVTYKLKDEFGVSREGAAPSAPIKESGEKNAFLLNSSF